MKALAIVFFTLLAAQSANARTWHILNDGSGDAPTVQTGIDSAAVGDTVLVGPGTYLENINFLGKGIVVKSVMGRDVTTLDGSSNQGPVVLFVGDETSDAVLEGFTITGGSGYIPEGVDGGGIYMEACSAIIRSNRIYRNIIESKGFGGGIWIGAPTDLGKPVTPLIEDNIFEENEAVNGGGMAVLWGQPIIRRNIFLRNRCRFDGGGIYVSMRQGAPVIIENEFWENVAPDHGGGMYISNRLSATGILIEQNLLVRNEAYGIGLGDTGSGGGIWTGNFPGKIVRNTIVFNEAFGETGCSGGGIVLRNTQNEVLVEANVIAFNKSCGISCKDNPQNVLGVNLLWSNQTSDLGASFGECPAAWSASTLIADPYFCDLGNNNYSVAQNSPALSGVVMGAFADPGCGPVPVLPTTWGRIKAKYGN